MKTVKCGRRFAFTLIELLIVVVIIAILAAISVPNFLEAQVRSKVARVDSDMAAVAQGLRSYYADYNTYPRHDPEVHTFLDRCSRVTVPNSSNTSQPADARYPWFNNSTSSNLRADSVAAKGLDAYADPEQMNYVLRMPYPILMVASYDLRVLTTPVAYIGTQLPVDPFADNKRSPFIYVNISEVAPTVSTDAPGPFQRYVLLSYGADTDQSAPDFVNPVRGPWLKYDPTNGTVSAGDIFRFGYDNGSPTSSTLSLPAASWSEQDWNRERAENGSSPISI